MPFVFRYLCSLCDDVRLIFSLCVSFFFLGSLRVFRLFTPVQVFKEQNISSTDNSEDHDDIIIIIIRDLWPNLTRITCGLFSNRISAHPSIKMDTDTIWTAYGNCFFWLIRIYKKRKIFYLYKWRRHFETSTILRFSYEISKNTSILSCISKQTISKKILLNAFFLSKLAIFGAKHIR